VEKKTWGRIYSTPTILFFKQRRFIMQVLDYTKHSVFVPFLIRRSKDSRVVIKEGRILSLPIKPVIEFIDDLKDEIKYDGFFLLGEDVVVTDITTDTDGWPIGLHVTFMDQDYYKPNMFMGFEIYYDKRTYRDVDIIRMMLCDDNYDLFY
jgi:hypothetical protein